MNDSLKSLSKTDNTPTTKPKRLPSWLIPAGIALGFALLFLLLFRDRILPATDVKVAVVLSTRAEPSADTNTNPTSPEPKNQSPKAWEGSMAFQASGWIEPDPLPIKATALASGVIHEVHVLEGEAVTKGQLLATLIKEDFDLKLRATESELKRKEASLEAHHYMVEVFQRKLKAAVAKKEATDALVTEAKDRFDRIKDLPKGALAETEATKISSDYLKAQANLRAAEAAVEQAKAEAIQHDAINKVIESEIEVARVNVDTAKLALARTEIKSPINGRILRLNSTPGQKKMLAMDDPDSATVAILYDPNHLQARVDVPLADASGLMVGQLARIKCNLLPDQTFLGEVTRITGEADIQRNTLQAKVRIIDPSKQLRPEMLCRVEFLDAKTQIESSTAESNSSHDLATWIPQRSLDRETVWICDPESKRVESRKVQPTETTRDGYRLIKDGLRPGEWVVLSPDNLSDNQRANPEMIQSP